MRVRFLQAGTTGIAGILLCFITTATIAADKPDFTLVTLGNGAFVAIANEGGRAGGNAGFVIGDDGVAVIDTFEDPAAAEELLAKIRELTKLPIKFVVNTHYHLDHVNGNDVFSQAGAIVFAQRNVRYWIRTENLNLVGGDSASPKLKARIESLPLPDVAYDTGVDLYLGRVLQVRVYEGHTGGDSVVVVPSAQVVYCGDLLWKDHFPNLIDASTDKWIETLKEFQSKYAHYTLVPGHGGIATAADAGQFENYLTDLRAAIQRGRANGLSGDALVKGVLPQMLEKYGKWGWSKDYAPLNIKETEEELAGTKKIPQVPGDRRN
ncbi:MAG TPA: MBL fold metallo-hydrolase [Candidatus Acidoferrales bacterium]|nr:MBL fold metallo-hydrolase [Candidatus Acidoferrales bacterium]